MPTVTGQSPAPGSSILPTTPITFSVTGIVSPFVLRASYSDGESEFIWDGAVFAPYYLGKSTAGAVSGGSQSFSILRTGGWKLAPTIDVVTGVPGTSFSSASASSLANLASSVDPSVATCLVAATDGTGGLFSWAASDATAADGFFVIASTFPSAPAGRWRRIQSAQESKAAGSLSVANGTNADLALPHSTRIEITGPSGAFSIDGLIPAASVPDGSIVELVNLTGQTMTIKHQSSSEATAARKIVCPGAADVVVVHASGGYEKARFVYSGSQSRWLLDSWTGQAVDQASNPGAGSKVITNGSTLVPSVGGAVVNRCSGAGAICPDSTTFAVNECIAVELEDGTATCSITLANASDHFYTAGGGAQTAYALGGACTIVNKGSNKFLVYP